MSKKLDDLLKKREQLNAQIQKERNKQSQQKRKEDTRRKILLGSLMMDLMKKGELEEKKIMKRLDGFLTKETDRKLFDCPITNEDSKQIKKTEKLDSYPTVEVILEETLKSQKLSVIKAIRKVTGLGIKETEELIETIPSLITKVDLKEAEQIKKFLYEAGARVIFKK